MITQLNFGEAPFHFIFLLVAIIFGVTLGMNLFAAVTRLVLGRRLRSVARRYADVAIHGEDHA